MDYQALFLTNEGRLDRQPFWIGVIILFIILLVARFIIHIIFGHGSGIAHLLELIVALVLLYPSVNLGIKRFHDRDKSGWWVLIVLIPVIGWIWYFIEAGCQGRTAPIATIQTHLVEASRQASGVAFARGRRSDRIAPISECRGPIECLHVQYRRSNSARRLSAVHRSRRRMPGRWPFLIVI